MAAPGIPQNVYVQQGNGNVLVSWDIQAGATSYVVSRSTDNVTFTTVATITANSYLDTTVTVGVLYYYTVASSNGTVSAASASQSIIPTQSGQVSLAQLRQMSQQRADRVNSNFVTLPEWNSYINQSAFELYDLLLTTYEDFYFANAYQFQTDGTNNQYALPQDFDKLLGVDLGLGANNNAWVTVHKFDFIQRNRYVYPNITSTFLGVFNMRYRLMGNKLFFIPTPSANQYVRVWYVPRMTQLLQDTDILDTVSGWSEYIVVDAAIKALQKEESDVSVLMAQKQALIKRIEESAMNRDEGEPDTISATRGPGSRDGNWGGPGNDGSYGGY